ncbi:MAG: hypothetical protein GY778_23940 [bacterium]|nr:hypothetical protein [bacterium]
MDSVCPECGRPSKHGLPIEQINRWAERLVIDLQGLFVLLVVGVGFAAPAAALPGVLLGMLVVPVCILIPGVVVYVALTLRYLRQRAGHNYRNLNDILRRKLSWWFWINHALVAGLVTCTLVGLMAF